MALRTAIPCNTPTRKRSPILATSARTRLSPRPKGLETLSRLADKLPDDDGAHVVDAETAGRLLLEALDLWRGRALVDVAAQFGCPTGTLASELGKRTDGLDQAAAAAMRELLDWVQAQFAAMDRDDAAELAVALIASYEGIALLTNTFRDPELMVVEGRRLERWIDSLVA